MITILSGTNRNDSMTLKVAAIAHSYYEGLHIPSQICDLNRLPKGLFEPEHYWNTPKEFAPFQKMILDTDGLVTIVPEYNGGIPGALKYFIDLLKFPESLQGKPACFVGVAAGRFGALRSMEQLEMVFQYRGAHLYGKRAMFMDVENKLDKEGDRITDGFTKEVFEETLLGFSKFSQRLKDL
ncbi:MAG: NAD(P)H-dependent oxidoreductase [Bacteriovoracales bacterium]|nr:NAD(P)H-dependent oxidoreductase [Bacteriovoracales bacterium]